MPVTLRDIVELPVVRAARPEVLVSAHWDELVRWVHVADVADLSDLLSGGEVILTVGTGLATAPGRYFDVLAHAGALGVIVELGSALDRLPQPTVDAARGAGVALVVLHRRIRFVELTEQVHRQIVAEQYDAVEFARLAHERFTELSLNRAPVTRIVETAAELLDLPVVLEDLAHQAIAVSATAPARLPDLLHDWQRRSRLQGLSTGGDWSVTTVGARGEEWARLIAPEPGDRRSRVAMVLERAAAALALRRMVERDRTGIHQQAQSGLIDDVLRGRITSEPEVAARAHALGLQHTTRYLPVVARMAHTEGGFDPVDAQRRALRRLDAISHTINSAGHSALLTNRGDDEIHGVLALRPGRVGVDEALTELGRALGRIAAREEASAHVLAVGAEASQIVAAVHMLRTAAHVAEAALAMHGERRAYYRAEDVRLRGLIALLHDDPRVQSFAETELRGLLATDAADGSAGLALLREYLRAGGNKSVLATRLHISRPALYKRLDALSRRLGVDLADPESMISLHVALLIIEAQPRAMKFSSYIAADE